MGTPHCRIRDHLEHRVEPAVSRAGVWILIRSPAEICSYPRYPDRRALRVHCSSSFSFCGRGLDLGTGTTEFMNIPAEFKSIYGA
jgi:hypothetical protein